MSCHLSQTPYRSASNCCNRPSRRPRRGQAANMPRQRDKTFGEQDEWNVTFAHSAVRRDRSLTIKFVLAGSTQCTGDHAMERVRRSLTEARRIGVMCPWASAGAVSEPDDGAACEVVPSSLPCSRKRKRQDPISALPTKLQPLPGYFADASTVDATVTPVNAPRCRLLELPP